MKKLFLLLFFAASGISLPLAAQDYAPFRMGRTPYFQAGDSVFSLRVDTVYIQGVDSVFEFNPRAVPVPFGASFPTCTGGTMNYASAIRTDNNLFGQKIVKSGSEYSFVFTTGETFLINPTTPIGQSWAFTSSLTATMQSRSAGFVHGLPDSILTISLSNGTSIQISKNYGLLNARSFHSYVIASASPQPVGLIRLPEVGIGNPVNDPLRIFNFQVGDKFKFYSFQETVSGMTCSESWSTEEILARTDYPSGDSIRYEVRYQILTNTYGHPTAPFGFCQGTTGTYLSPFSIGTLTIRASDYPMLRLLGFGYATQPQFPNFISPNTGMYVSQYSNRIGTGFSQLQFDTCSNAFHEIIDLVHSENYVEGLGFVRSRTYSFSGSGHDLIAYIKGGETYGNWAPLSGLFEQEHALLLHAFPNPFTSNLTIQLPEFSTPQPDISVFDALGRVVHQQTIPAGAEGHYSLDLPGLPDGLYLLKLQQGDKSYTAKVQRQ